MKMHKKSVRKTHARRARQGSFIGGKVRASSSLVAPGKSESDVRRLSRAYNLSNEAVSRVTGASPRTVSYWNAGVAPQRSSAQKLREVTRLFDAVASDGARGECPALADDLADPRRQRRLVKPTHRHRSIVLASPAHAHT